MSPGRTSWGFPFDAIGQDRCWTCWTSLVTVSDPSPDLAASSRSGPDPRACRPGSTEELRPSWCFRCPRRIASRMSNRPQCGSRYSPALMTSQNWTHSRFDLGSCARMQNASAHVMGCSCRSSANLGRHSEGTPALPETARVALAWVHCHRRTLNPWTSPYRTRSGWSFGSGCQTWVDYWRRWQIPARCSASQAESSSAGQQKPGALRP